MSEVHVAVGVILAADGESIFLARRLQTAHQGGLWEFPGGKVEAGESVDVALRRELHEELGIDMRTCEPLVEVRHDYGDKQVFLDVHVVTAFNGEPHGREGQETAWCRVDQLASMAFPAANRPIVDAVLKYTNR